MKETLTIISAIFGLFLLTDAQEFLSVAGRNLTLNGEKVFLSGMNQPWYKYSRDFGHRFYEHSRPHLLKTLDVIHKNGGNSVRIWLHTTGANTPVFNSSGFVVGLDKQITRDLVDYVKQAQQRNILVTLTLWNCAGNKEKDFPVFGLIREDRKLKSYIRNALPKLVKALKKHRAMAIWEIINEPEGCIVPGVRDYQEPCYDTTSLSRIDGAGWTGRDISLERMLRFISLHAHVIHKSDPKALVTVGSWKYMSVTNQLNRRNFYSDTCLTKASKGRKGAKLDLYQIHTYTDKYWEMYAPFRVDGSLYNLDKPVIIGEFSQRKGGGMTSPELFYWAYGHGYNGAWSWSAIGSDTSSDNLTTQKRGLKSLKDKNNQSKGGTVHIDIKSKKKKKKVKNKRTKKKNKKQSSIFDVFRAALKSNI